jgi:hypothetical protein
VLLPTDTNRKLITSITAVLLPFVTNSLTLSHTVQGKIKTIKYENGYLALVIFREKLKEVINSDLH